MGQFDPNLVRYITEFLKQCNKCKCYNINNRINTCCICSDFYCENCSKELQYLGYYDETIQRYCSKCVKQFFHN